METAILAEIILLTFMMGFAFGVVVKGIIDARYEKRVQKSLVVVGRMADDEIEEKDRAIRERDNEIEALKRIINDLKFGVEEIDA